MPDTDDITTQQQPTNHITMLHHPTIGNISDEEATVTISKLVATSSHGTTTDTYTVTEDCLVTSIYPNPDYKVIPQLLNATLTKEYHWPSLKNMSKAGPEDHTGIPLFLRIFQNTDMEKRAKYARPVEAVGAAAFGVLGIIFVIAEIVVMCLCDVRLCKRHLAKARRDVCGKRSTAKPTRNSLCENVVSQ